VVVSWRVPFGVDMRMSGIVAWIGLFADVPGMCHACGIRTRSVSVLVGQACRASKISAYVDSRVPGCSVCWFRVPERHCHRAGLPRFAVAGLRIVSTLTSDL
jgi:hypothetical protein